MGSDPGRRSASLVYIAGYGRSGSTLLDTLLSSAPGAWGGGELSWLFASAAADDACSCGETVRQCAFWSEVLALLWGTPRTADLEAAARLTARAQTASGSWRGVDDPYQALWRRTHEAIRAVGETRVIIDSSKTTRATVRRPALLDRAGEAVAVLHLVRDPRDVMRSVAKGSNRRLERDEDAAVPGGRLRALLSWTLTNSVTDTWTRGRERACRLRYEDLVATPSEEMERITRVTGLDLAPVLDRIARGGEFPGGHAIAGNRMRRSGPVRLRTGGTRSRDTLIERTLPLLHPLMRRYGYRD